MCLSSSVLLFVVFAEHPQNWTRKHSYERTHPTNGLQYKRHSKLDILDYAQWIQKCFLFTIKSQETKLNFGCSFHSSAQVLSYPRNANDVNLLGIGFYSCESQIFIAAFINHRIFIANLIQSSIYILPVSFQYWFGENFANDLLELGMTVSLKFQWTKLLAYINKFNKCDFN